MELRLSQRNPRGAFPESLGKDVKSCMELRLFKKASGSLSRKPRESVDNCMELSLFKKATGASGLSLASSLKKPF
jgi:hypothetical protein